MSAPAKSHAPGKPKSDAPFNWADPLLLEFDHRAGELKVDAVATLIWERRWQDVRDEIAKCDVRCVRCHRCKAREPV